MKDGQAVIKNAADAICIKGKIDEAGAEIFFPAFFAAVSLFCTINGDVVFFSHVPYHMFCEGLETSVPGGDAYCSDDGNFFLFHACWFSVLKRVVMSLSNLAFEKLRDLFLAAM